MGSFQCEHKIFYPLRRGPSCQEAAIWIYCWAASRHFFFFFFLSWIVKGCTWQMICIHLQSSESFFVGRVKAYIKKSTQYFVKEETYYTSLDLPLPNLQADLLKRKVYRQFGFLYRQVIDLSELWRHLPNCRRTWGYCTVWCNQMGTVGKLTLFEGL